MRGSVTLHMQADPSAIWALVTDVTRIGEFSPETFEAEWLDGATGPAVGAKFRGHVKRNGVGPTYWSPCEVTVCEPGSVFEFAVGGADRVLNTWRYEITPTDDGGADVTESFALPSNPFTRVYWALLGRARGRTNERGMRQTLERIRAVLEA
ncbi:MAG: SRPBCC family protein [Actinomycetes bacterium]|jgi:hypothetical protein